MTNENLHALLQSEGVITLREVAIKIGTDDTQWRMFFRVLVEAIKSGELEEHNDGSSNFGNFASKSVVFNHPPSWIHRSGRTSTRIIKKDWSKALVLVANFSTWAKEKGVDFSLGIPTIQTKTEDAQINESSNAPLQPTNQTRTEQIVAMVAKHGGNKSAAARELGVDRKVVYRHCPSDQPKKTGHKVTANNPFGKV